MNKKVFLIAVGGIGVSSLAKYLHKNGYDIYGSDLNKNENVLELIKNYDLTFYQRQEEENISSDFEFIIYSPAIGEDNPERIKGKELKIPEYSYPEFLGKISQDKFTISIAGTNGKTTTTTMTAEVLENFKKDPTVVMGGVAKKFNSNFITGESDIFLVESCEYKNSFLHISPDIIAITNVTPDHLDYFGTFENYKKVFIDFIDKFKNDGKEKILICSKKDENLSDIVIKAQEKGIKVVDYYDYKIDKVAVPGEYNRENAKIVLAIADIFNLDLDQVRNYLENNFVGPARRFDYKGEINAKSGARVYDDYAHNPEALKVLLSGIKEKYPQRKNILVFQPHLFSRTEDFFDEFVEDISSYDEIYLLPIYKARENPEDFKISSKMLFEEIKKKNKNIIFSENIDICVKEIKEKNYDNNFVLITAGAGDVYKVADKLVV